METEAPAPPFVPEPIDLFTPSLLQQGARVRRTLRTFRRHLGPHVARRATGRGVDELELATSLCRVFERLGTTYVKFGQVVAQAPGFFGREVSGRFRPCLDTGPPVRFDRIQRLVEKELGAPIEATFAEFDPEPIGRASIAVVHRAVTLGGEEVAVKLLRPGIERRVATDLAIMKVILPEVSRLGSGELADMQRQMLDGFSLQLREELNLLNEVRALQLYEDLLGDLGVTSVTVPRPHPELSSRRILTMEFLDGVAVDDVSAIDDLGLDAAPLVVDAMKAWFITAIRYGIFHGDVHAGNLMILRDGRIAMIDWGIVGRLEPRSHWLLRRVIEAALGDEQALEEVTDYFLDQTRDFLSQGLGLPEEQARRFFQQQLTDALTRPFAQINIGEFLTQRQKEMSLRRIPLPGLGTITSRFRRREAPDLDRGMFLMGKQLMFFESHGRLHLPERALLQDRAFFERVLHGQGDGEVPPAAG
ncbi:MAG: hypothetical protein JJLCMIEE_02994 [Acidimicrobiales bacterium]|nr:hypothetical protein [Acidimicrobiales bacterium]